MRPPRSGRIIHVEPRARGFVLRPRGHRTKEAVQWSTLAWAVFTGQGPGIDGEKKTSCLSISPEIWGRARSGSFTEKAACTHHGL